MPLPFDSLQETETVSIAGLVIPKHGCLTVAEERAARDLQAELASNEEFKNLSEAQADLWLKEQIVTILIRSRLDRDWSLEKMRSPKWEVTIGEVVKSIEPTMLMLDALFDFFMGEQRRWRDLETLPDSTEEGSKKKTASTGKKSTGNSGSATQEKNGSAPKNLVIAQ